MSLGPGARTEALRKELTDLLGAGAVLGDEDQRRFHSADIYEEGPTAALVVRPDDRKRLAAAISAAPTLPYRCPSSFALASMVTLCREIASAS